MFNFLNPKTMQKQLTLLAAMALALVACNKSQTVITETPGEISFKAVASVATKADAADIVQATTLNADYVIYAAASTPTKQSFFGKTLFKKDDAGVPTAESTVYYPYSGEDKTQIYWPMAGEKVDFLAYSLLPAAETALSSAIAFDGTTPANVLTISEWDTYTNQYDVLYSAANGKSNSSAAVNLPFSHAQSLLAFKAKTTGTTENIFKITAIEILDLENKGTFTVNNEKTLLKAAWSSLSHDGTCTIKNIADEYVPITTSTQIGDMLLVPEQDSKSIKITYKLGTDATTEYNVIVPLTRRVWEMGHKYTYDLTLTVNEITFTESVTDWTSETAENISVPEA